MTPKKTVLAILTSAAVIALFGCGDNESSTIGIDASPPATPTGLTIVEERASIEVSWDANSEPDLAGYVVERSVDRGSTWESVDDDLLTETSYTDYKRASAWYRVAAKDHAKNQSGFSSGVEFHLGGPVNKLESATWQPQ